MSKSNPVTSTEVVDTAEITETQVFQPQKMYELDSSLIAEEFFAPIALLPQSATKPGLSASSNLPQLAPGDSANEEFNDGQLF